MTNEATPDPLSPQHVMAVNRRRRTVVNFDVTFAINTRFRHHNDLEAFVNSLFTFTDAEGSQIDSVWWNWGEGNQVPYASETRPLYDHPLYQNWVKNGVDVVKIVLDATRRRGREVFFSHRMNGSDNDLGPFAVIPLKVEHPEWTFRTPWCTHEHNRYWNFTLREVHRYVLQNLREVAEQWDFDGIELDFARGVVFPSGQAWTNRDMLTEFVRSVRTMLLEVEAKRGRPFLLAARVPENLVGCHYDGLDVETWAREHLVDLFALGIRSFEVDVAAFRRITAGTPIRLYPSIDDHHASDGYQNPGIEVFRGAAANWWRQGADGIHTMNFNYAPDEPYGGEDWQSHRRFYREVGDPDVIRHKNKIFVLQRRGGGHGPTVIPNPEDWSTPRHMYANTNMLAPLPAPLDNTGKVDTLLHLYIGDDLSHEAEHIESITLRVLLSDPASESLPDNQRLESATVSIGARAGGVLTNLPPAKGMDDHIELRLNNVPLDRPTIEYGWVVFAEIPPSYFSVGHNLVGVRVSDRAEDADGEILVEKLELDVRYE